MAKVAVAPVPIRKSNLRAKEAVAPALTRKSNLSWSVAQAKLSVVENWSQIIRFNLITGPRIVFDRFSVNAGDQIYSMNPKTGEQINLSNSPGQQDETPAISPKNGNVVFSRGGGYSGALYTMDSGGSAQSALPPPPAGSFDVQPAWSHSGQQIAFCRFYQIWIANADGTGARALMNYSAPPYVLDHAPTWSPDGRQIAFWREQGGNSAIMRVSSTPGSTPTNITDGRYFDGSPSWSPDGSRIAFWRNDGTQGAIWTISVDGQGQATNVSQPDHAHGVADRFPCWSPDGSQIAFSRTSYIDWDIWIMGKDGSSPSPYNLSKGSGGHCDFYANWQDYP